jgi:hypothetical protein
MSMTSPQSDRRCEICGREFPSVEEASEHLQTEHGGPSGREPGGTTTGTAGDTDGPEGAGRSGAS